MKKALLFLLVSALFAENGVKSLEELKIASSELKPFDMKPPEMTPPEMTVPELPVPSMNPSGGKQPEIKQPEIKQTEIKQPEVKQPEINIPEIKQPVIKEPEIEEPVIKEPDIHMPKIQNSGYGSPSKEIPQSRDSDGSSSETPNKSWKNLFRWKKTPPEKEVVSAPENIEWYHDYDKAVGIAKEKKLPLFLFFSGTDWCPWCKKLEKNVLSKSEFYKGLTDKYVFCLVDFPMKDTIDPQQLKRNKALMQEYEVIGFPTIAIVDVDKGLITKIGYLSISPTEYREYVLEVTETFYSSDVALEDPSHLSEGDWERLSMNAKRLGSPYFQEKLQEKGIKSCPSPFFLIEKYERVLTEKGPESKEALILKERIKKVDPTNVYKSHYKLAILEFHVLTRTENLSPLKAISPLVEYISKFGNKTPDLWKLHFMIAHFLFSKNEVKTALLHAKLSFKLAPEKIRKELAETIGSYREK